MDYQFLTDKDKQDLVTQRVLSLEADHYKLELLIQESTDLERTTKLIEQQEVLRAAIDVHLGRRDEYSDEVQTAASP